MADPAPGTRYEQVKEILDLAASKSPADYDGHGNFWHLPLLEFLDLEIYGVRMIAPPEVVTPSCCHHVEGSGDEAAAGRGSRSGLIRGLRGQPPFDGSQYPPLPWGGRAVPDEEISFISNWIDDGCPAEDHQTTFGVEGTATEATLEEISAGNVEPMALRFEVYEGSPNEFSYRYGEIKQRMNLDCMSETPRIGETLPPPARSILEHLGVWEAFQAQRHRDVHGTTAVWGTSTPLDNDFIYMPGGAGWHLERAEFDAMLAAQAERQGAALRLNTRLRQTERVKGSRP